MTSEMRAMQGEVTVEWLTQVLRQAGILSHEAVISVESEPIGSVFNSQTQRLHARYSSETASLPTHFVLKRNTQEDLANLLATFWTRAQRQEGQREQRALRHFYQTLTAHGVSDYSWNDLLRDYRLGIIDWLFMPVWDATNGSRRDYWWPKMHCLFQAFQDWECLALMAE